MLTASTVAGFWSTDADIDVGAFHRELRRRNLPVVFWTAIVFNPVYLLWSVFDYYLVPEVWGFFLALRLTAAVIISLIAFTVSRFALERYSWGGFWLIAFTYAVFVAVMLPYSGAHLTRYIMGFAVILFGAGILPVWSPRWGLSFNLSAVIVGAGVFALKWGTAEIPPSDVVTGAFVVLTAFGLSVFAAIFKYDLARRDYRSRSQLAAVAQRESEARQDLTRTSDHLQQALEKLKELDRLKSKFFANISHELRTPLTMILAPVDDLRQRTKEPHDRQQLRVIRRNAERLLSLISDLLDLSRLDAGGLRLNLAEMDIRSVAAAVHENSVPAARAKGLSFRLAIEVSEKKIWGDAHRLEIVLTNLVSNAVKFTPEEGRIEISVTDRADGVRVSVTNDGPGIPPEDLPQVFERFFQVKPIERRREGGVGIGLALAKELIELHGGTIHVASEPGSLTTFTVDLPFGRDHIRPDAVERRQRFRQPPTVGRRVGDIGAPLEVDDLDDLDDHTEIGNEMIDAMAPVFFEGARRPRILVVEDHNEVRDFITKLLAPHYDTTSADDGEKALDLIRNAVPDLVVSDVMMPVMSGTELCRAIKTDPKLRAIPVILLTARVGSEATLEAYAHGADDFVPKPFHPGVLMARIRAQLKLRALGFQLAQHEKLAVVGTLAAGILHEVRNPVNAIVNAGKILLSGVSDDDTRRDLCEVIVDGGQRIEEITSALDTHARPAEAGAGAPCDVRQGLDATIRLLKHKLGETTIHKRYESDRLAQAPPGPLNQVFLNLVDNALLAGADTLWLQVNDSEKMLQITVEDNGPGVPAEHAQRIFDPFYTKRSDGTGTGLGLYLSRRIVEELDGSLHLEDRPGGGARFIVEIPVLEDPDDTRSWEGPGGD